MSAMQVYRLPHAFIQMAADLCPLEDCVAALLQVHIRGRLNPQYATELQVWNYREPRRLAELRLDERNTWHLPPFWQPPSSAEPRYGYSLVRFSPSGESILVYDGSGALALYRWDGTRLAEAWSVQVPIHLELPTCNLTGMEWAPGGRRFAVVLSCRPFTCAGGEVRVYSARTGRVVWRRTAGPVNLAGLAWSSDGTKMAVTLIKNEPVARITYSLPPQPPVFQNLYILSSGNGAVLKRIATGDRAGPVCFAPNGDVLTAPIRIHEGFVGPGELCRTCDKVKVWNSATWKLLRKIHSPGRDIYNSLEVSRDGKRLLVYVGREKNGFVWRDMESADILVDARFQVIDLRTGAVIAASPDMASDKHNEAYPTPPSLRFGPNGTRVLVYWPSGIETAAVYELSPADR